MEREYKVVCFDLDGTLLPMDIEEFMGAYFKRIEEYMVDHGLNGELFSKALGIGSRHMMEDHPGQTNEEVFWERFFEIYPVRDEAEQKRLKELADEFYEKDFASIGNGLAANPSASRVVEKLKSKGYPLALTTMPMFPLRAVRHRLFWAGVDPGHFERITSYENSFATKPKLAYYQETLDAMGVSGEEVLMVGNNTLEDLAFMELGADAYLVTDNILNPNGFDVSSVRNGTLREFEDWVDLLPVCAEAGRADSR